MTKQQAFKALRVLEQRGVYVLAKRDLEKLFPDEQEKTFQKSLQRLVADGILERVAKGIYLNAMAASAKRLIVEYIASAMRRGYFSYISLESALSEYGAISQVPMSRITVMTTGAKGTYDTPYGTIEFTHTKRSPAEIVQRSIVDPNRPLRIASKEAALQDLRRVGRNLDLLIPSGSNA